MKKKVTQSNVLILVCVTVMGVMTLSVMNDFRVFTDGSNVCVVWLR